MFNIIEMSSGWKLDLIIRKARAFSLEELGRLGLVTLLEMPVDTATAEDTLIAKLEWAKVGASERQLEDVAGILRVQGDRLDRAYIDRWVVELELDEQWRTAQTMVHAPAG